MAKDKKSFILYVDQQGVFNQLPDEMAGKLIKHIFAYVNDENPQTEDLIINIAFEPIKQQLKRDLVKYNEFVERQSINGKKGGRPTKPNETQKTQPFLDKPKKADNVSDNDNENENEKDNYTNEFEQLWILYTRKGSKLKSFNAFNKLNKSEVSEISEHIPKYIENHVNSDKMDFLPHFTTYLNEKRWNDIMPYRNGIARERFQMRNIATLDDD